jgi:hypothetical protein
LLREFGSHLRAEIVGWDFAASYGEVMAGLYAEAYVNVHRDTKSQPEPRELLHPWPSATRAEEVTPEERARLRALLLANSAFRDR